MSVGSMAARRVLVTGGAGFIGRHLLRRLAAAGANVLSVSRREPEDVAGDVGVPEVEWHRVDLCDAEATWSLLEATRPEVVVHLAGLVKGSRDRSAVLPMLDVNLRAAVILMEGAVRVGCRRFVQAGSLEEPDDLESAPSSPYAVSKMAASAYARLFAEHYGLSTAVARIFMVYGPGAQDENKLVPYVIRRLLAGQPLELSGGTRPVDWIHVDDVVDGLLALAAGDAPLAELGTGRLHTVREMVEAIAAVIDPDAELPFGSRGDRAHERVRHAVLSLNSGLDWRPGTSLEDGVEDTIRWFREHPPSEGRSNPEAESC